MKLGFIGTGNMAGAIMGGIIRNEIFKPEEIIGADISKESRSKVQSAYGINVTEDNKKAASESEVLVLSVKPQYYAETIKEIKDCVREDQLIITIAPGKTLKWLEEQFEKKVKIVRAMPNTPALVGEGMTAACANDAVTEEEKEYALKILRSFGKVEIVAENMIDAVVAVAEALLHMYLCLLKRWRMRLCRKECRESRRMNLPRRQFTEVQRWCSIRENIRQN